jgi:hypothetical protein
VLSVAGNADDLESVIGLVGRMRVGGTPLSSPPPV